MLQALHRYYVFLNESTAIYGGALSLRGPIQISFLTLRGALTLRGPILTLL